MSEQRLDGNAAAGFLAQIFAFDVTTAIATCSGCGMTGPVAKLLLYGGAMGAILRCPGCDTALMRVSSLETGYWVDMSGTRMMRVAIAG